MSARHLLIVGHTGSTHVGRHFQRAAEALGFSVDMCDAADAYAGPAWRRRAEWWLRGRRPARLDEFGRTVLAAARETGPALVLATGAFLLAAVGLVVATRGRLAYEKKGP